MIKKLLILIAGAIAAHAQPLTNQEMIDIIAEMKAGFTAKPAADKFRDAIGAFLKEQLENGVAISDPRIDDALQSLTANPAATISAQSNITFRSPATCPAGQYATARTVTGSLTCSVPPSGADPWIYVVLGSDFTTGSGTAVDVTGLAFTPAANLRYDIEATLFCRATTATVGPRPGIAWPSAGVTDGVARIQAATTTATNVFANGNSIAAFTVLNTGLPNTTQSWVTHMDSKLLMTAGAAGTWRIQLASETAATNVTIKAGSFLRYRTF